MPAASVEILINPWKGLKLRALLPPEDFALLGRNPNKSLEGIET